jgi:hypothetical protein
MAWDGIISIFPHRFASQYAWFHWRSNQSGLTGEAQVQDLTCW